MEPERQSEYITKAFDFADGWAKLLSSLAAGTLALSATFIKDILPEGSSLHAKPILFVAWSILGITILLGPLLMGSLIWELNKSDDSEPDAATGPIRLLGTLQALSFLAGILLFALFVAKNL